MEHEKPPRCPENAAVAAYLLTKRQEMTEKPRGVSENLDLTLSKAYRSICGAESPIRTLKDLSEIKGVGKWILRIMKGFFPEGSSDPTNHAARNGKKARGAKRYVPQKSSAAYAILITLYRGTVSGSDFMRKQELIDATEASGLSRTSIGPEKGKSKPGQFGTSPKDWHTGWSCVKTLIEKGLVVKSCCPAKYMITQEGQEVASECLQRSGLVDSAEKLAESCESQSVNGWQKKSDKNFVGKDSTLPSQHRNSQIEVDLHSANTSKMNTQSGHFDYQNSKSSGSVAVNRPVLWTASACKNQGISVADGKNTTNYNCDGPLNRSTSAPVASASSCLGLRTCSSSDRVHFSTAGNSIQGDPKVLAMPPLGYGEIFGDCYDLILILDDRENFGAKKVLDILLNQFKVKVEVRRLPVGDGIWIGRHKRSNDEYVLDFIVERKNVQDLSSSIRDNRYKDQKLRLQRCGIQKLIYLVEGDLNMIEAAESAKTACFTTEILEGFDVQRSTGLTDTIRRYGQLTQAIHLYYNSAHFSGGETQGRRTCPPFGKFIERCRDINRITVSDVLALQLMQVPQVTEETALAVVALFPTIASLSRAYSNLEGDPRAQEEMLKNRNPAAIGAAASRNIFRLVWGT